MTNQAGEEAYKVCNSFEAKLLKTLAGYWD